MVHFDVCKKALKLIGYHSNVPLATTTLISFIISIHMSTNAEMFMKFGPVLAEIFGKICRFLQSRPKSYRNSKPNL